MLLDSRNFLCSCLCAHSSVYIVLYCCLPDRSIYTSASLSTISKEISLDGTRKWLLKFCPPDKKSVTGKSFQEKKTFVEVILPSLFHSKSRSLFPQVETVFIPSRSADDAVGTLCVSSQAGCTLSCTFCATGTRKLERNLLAEEIVMQVQVARIALREFDRPIKASDTRARMITNIVFMGMHTTIYIFFFFFVPFWGCLILIP